MQRALDNFKLAMSIVGLFVFFGFVGAGFWWVFELITGYTENLFRLAGY